MMKKLFKWGAADDGKGKKASGRSSEGLVRGPDIPVNFKAGPLLLAAGENGTPEKELPDLPAPRPVPSFITNSVNLPSYGQSAAIPLPLPSGAIALPLPEPTSPGLPSNPQGNPQSLPTQESKSPGGFGSSNQRLAPEGDASASSEKGVSSKSGLTISHTGGSKSSYPSPRPQKGLASVFRGKAEGGARTNQNPLPFNFPNQRPSPLETVLNGQKRVQVGSPSASEPFVSPQQLSEMTTPSPLLTSRSGPEWTSSVPPVSPFWNRGAQASGTPLHPKLRRSPSLNSNSDTDNSNTGSPLSRFSPVGQANLAATPGKAGKSAPSSPAALEGPGTPRPDGFGAGHSLVSALSEPPIGTDTSELHALSDSSEMLGSIPSTSGEEKRTGGELGRHLLGLEPLEESGQDSTSEASSIGGGSESTELSAGNWVGGSSPNRGAFQTPRVHFDLNPPQSSPVLGGSNATQISPRGKAHAELVDAPMQDPPRQKEVGAEDLTRSTTPRTAEALQRETGRQKGSQTNSQAPLGTRSPQKPLAGAANRVQRPVNTHLNVPKQLTPITAGPAWHESIAGLPGSSSETPSSAPQAHPLPDIDQAYTPPSRGGSPSPKEGTSLPPAAPSLASRGNSRGLSTRPLPSPENLHHHARASSDGRIHTKSQDNTSPGSGKPMQFPPAGGMADSASRPKPLRGQSEPISRGLLDAAYLPRPDAHHLPLSEAARTSSDPARLTQRRASLDQDATPLPLPLPPAEEKTSRAVNSSQSPISPAQPSPLPALPLTAYPLNQNVLSTSKPAPLGSVSPSPSSTRCASPHLSPISVLHRGDRTGRELRGVNADTVAQGPRLPVNWRKSDKLGSGTFGSVYRGLNTDNGEMFAVKEVGEAQQNVMDESTSQLEHEVALLSRLKHPNIVQYVGTKREDNKLYIFLEFMPGGSIESNLRFGPFPEPLIRSYTKQILYGLKYLHDQSTIHRDIKGANILVDIHGRVKLADFGMAKEIREGHSQSKSGMKGSPFWMAPEVVKQERRADGRPADIWSVGCTVLEMAEGAPPWSRDCTNAIQIMWKIASSNDYPHIPAHLSETAVHFIKLCLNRSPDERPKADDLLNHPFIADVIPETPPGMTIAFPRASPPGTPSPRPLGLVIPRAANRTAHSPGSLATTTPRLSRQTSGKLEELAEEEESVSATVAALVDTQSPRGGAGSKVVPVVGPTSGKHQGVVPKLRPKTPPPNWSPTGAITDEPKASVKVRVGEVSVSGRGLEETAKPRLRWKSPTSSFEAEGSTPDLDDPATQRRATLFRHKSADAPMRRPLGTLLEDKEIQVGRLHKGISVPVPAKREGPLDKVGANIVSVVSNQRRYVPSEVG